MTHGGVSAVNRVKIKTVPLNTIVAGIIITRGPNLSKICPMTGDITPFNKLPGSKIKPAVAAANVIGPGLKKGKMMSEEKFTIKRMKNMKTAERKEINLITSKSLIMYSTLK